MNIGKKFEQAIAKSAPDYVKIHKLPDSAQSFGGCNNLRFSRKNPFDYILWDSKYRILYALELKTVDGKSISFERTPDEKKEIHYHQIQGLTEWNQYNGIVGGFIIEFRKIETTIFLYISDFNELLKVIHKKSFNFDDLKKYNIPYAVIPQTKMKTRYIYDIDYMLKIESEKELIREESK